MMTRDYAGLLDRLRQRLGPSGILTDPSDTDPYCEDWRSLYHGRTPAVLRPANTAETADAVRLCAEYGVPVVPQGGNTSMVGGAAVSEDGSQIILSLSRMTRVRDIDPVDMTMEIEAGVALKAAQLAAEEADCLLPLSISSEGSAQIGGVLATNAGGNNTVRYGNARDLVLGLEVVLPDGQVWNGLRRLHKDNTGYCFVFSCSPAQRGRRHHHRRDVETLPAAARGRGRAVRRRLARCGVAAFPGLPTARRRDDPGVRIHVGRRGWRWSSASSPTPGHRSPRPPRITCSSSWRRRAKGRGCAERSKELLAAAMERGIVVDAVIAESGAQRAAIWKLREEHSEAQKRAGASVKNDISVPVSRVPELIRRAAIACERLMPGIRCVPFGHLGDGNIHFNLVQPEGTDGAAFLARDHGS